MNNNEVLKSNFKFRREVVNCIIDHAQKNEKIYLLVCDMGFGACDKFKENFPNRIINVGIMEQATVGIAAGMAMSGLIPIVYSIVNFLVFRALEQIRNDVILQNLNVKFIGTGANNYFKFLGKSHCCNDDDKKIFEIIGLKVFDPYELDDENQFQNLVDQWIISNEAGYIRV